MRQMSDMFTDIQLSVTGAPRFGSHLVGNYTASRPASGSGLWNLRGDFPVSQSDASSFGELYQSSKYGFRPALMRLTTAGF